MPIYEYACKNCGCNLEVFQGINDVPLSLCRECNQPSLIKLVSAAGFRLKGGGWYETDFKKEGDKKRNVVTEEGSNAIPSSLAQNKDTVPTGASTHSGSASNTSSASASTPASNE